MSFSSPSSPPASSSSSSYTRHSVRPHDTHDTRHTHNRTRTERMRRRADGQGAVCTTSHPFGAGAVVRVSCVVCVVWPDAVARVGRRGRGSRRGRGRGKGHIRVLPAITQRQGTTPVFSYFFFYHHHH